MHILGTMAPKMRHEDIQAMQKRLKDETLEEEGTPEVSGSVEELSIQLDLDTDIPYTRATTRLGQTQNQVILFALLSLTREKTTVAAPFR